MRESTGLALDVLDGVPVAAGDRTLDECERVIAKGKRAFILVGQALLEIRDRRLYRQTHPTFEAYCRERWGWGRESAYKHIAAAKVAENVESIPHAQPSYTQAVQLAPLPAEHQRRIAARVDFEDASVAQSSGEMPANGM